MFGPPGAGKTMLARRLPGLLPPPDFDEALEITRIQSVVGMNNGRLVRERPFRAPHHTISPSGLVGGGSLPRPSEITLAHATDVECPLSSGYRLGMAGYRLRDRRDGLGPRRRRLRPEGLRRTDWRG